MRQLSSVLALLVVLPSLWSMANASAQDWPEFRGPHGDGRSDAKGLPLTWSETENVKWKTPIPYEGWSTPVAMDGQIWLTTATTDGKDFYAICVDATSGQIVLNEALFHSDNPEPLGNAVNCYASPSLAMEPGRVYVHFGSYGTACLDTASKQVVWKRTDLPCRHYRGPGSSPILFRDLLLLTFDGADRQYTVALNKTTGETVWKTDRSTAWTDLDEDGQPKREGDFRKAFSTPILIDAAGKTQLVSLGSSAFFGYDALTGNELWKLPNTAYSPASRPVFGNGLIYAITGRGGHQELYALRPDGQGDLTDAQVAWKFAGPEVPTEPSVLLVDGLLYVVSNNGVLTCLEAATGTQVWTERLGGNFLASPIYADGRIYLCSTQGKTTVITSGRAYEALATNVLDDGFMASPAILGKALILRTKTHLYCIEAPAS